MHGAESGAGRGVRSYLAPKHIRRKMHCPPIRLVSAGGATQAVISLRAGEDLYETGTRSLGYRTAWRVLYITALKYEVTA